MQLTVMVAPRGPLHAVRSVLHDWAAAGLVADFAWVEVPDNPGPELMCIHHSAGQQHGTTLSAIVADTNARQIQLCVLVPILDDIPAISATEEDRIAQLLRAAGATVQPIRAVITRLGIEHRQGEVAHEGWHNFVLTPEDRAAPATPPVLLTQAGDALDIGVHAAAGLAGLLGLWSAVPTSAVKATPTAGSYARLVGSYYRQLNADHVEDSLRDAVFSMSNGFPRPTRQGTAATYVTDPATAARTMADQWFQKHSSALRGPREQAPSTQVKTVTLTDALRHFFGYMLAALKNAPAAWLKGLEARLYSAVARRVTNAIYGEQSAYTVVVRGISRDGTPARFLEVSSGADLVAAALGDAGLPMPQEGHADNAPLWNDFVSGALTLADGGTRTEQLPPIRVNAEVGVVRYVDWVSPPASAAFHGLEGQLAAVLGDVDVPAFDVLAVRDLERRLDAHAHTPGLQFEVSAAREHLKQWWQNTKPSYTTLVSARIAQLWESTVTEVRDLMGTLDAAAGKDELANEDENRLITTRIRRLSLGVLLAVLIVVLVTVFGLIGALIGTLVSLAVLIGGVVTLLLTFYYGYKKVFQLIHQKEAIDQAAEVASRNLQQALRDVRRIADAYGQLMAWAPVLGRFLTEPFGALPPGRRRAVRLAGALPRGMRIGTAVRDEAAEAAVAADVRRRLFTVGWLTDPWDSLIKDAARRIGPDATGQLDSARALYAQLSAASSSDDALLDRWAASVADEGVGSYQAGRMWQEVLASLREDQEVALTGRIQVQGDRNLEITRSQFFDGLDAAGDVDALFTAGVLSDVAATANASRMVQCERFSNPSRLSRDLVVTWFSAPIASWDFALSDDRQPEASPAHADYTIPSMARLDAAPASPGPAPDDAGDWQMPAAPPGW